METDIVVVGFCQSEHSYGLRHMHVIEDGDSSVMATIHTYDMFVEKLECANHACKCYQNHLEALAKNHQWKRRADKMDYAAIDSESTYINSKTQTDRIY